MKLWPLLFLPLLFALPLGVQAQSSTPQLSITPAKFELKIEPGQVQEEAMTITNDSNGAMVFKAEAMDFAPSDDKGNISYGLPLPGRSAKSWFTIAPSDFLLAPHETKSITIQISPPDSLAPGSYFAVSMFEATVPASGGSVSEQSTTQIVPWIGSLFLLRVGEAPPLTDASLKIESVQYPKFNFHRTLPVQVTVTNATNFLLTPKADFILQTLTGHSVAQTTNDDTSIMPGKSRIFYGVIRSPGWGGLYKGAFRLAFHDYSKTITMGLVVLITVLGMGAVAVLLGLVVWLFNNRQMVRRKQQQAWLAIRHRLHRSATVLLGRDRKA